MRNPAVTLVVVVSWACAQGCVQAAAASRDRVSPQPAADGAPSLVPLVAAAPATQPPAARAAPAQDPPPAGGDAGASERWQVAASAYTYFTEDHDYVQPTFTADRGDLHLELRFNYEGLDTGSAWVGRNLAGADDAEVTWSLTPMIGVVFGEVQGIAPGYRGTVAWWRLELFAEGEYVIDTAEGPNYFYNWSELTIAPTERLRVGVVAQRTRVYDTERDIQRGLLVGYGLGPVDVTAHLFNPDDSEPVFVVSAALGF